VTIAFADMLEIYITIFPIWYHLVCHNSRKGAGTGW